MQNVTGDFGVNWGIAKLYKHKVHHIADKNEWCFAL